MPCKANRICLYNKLLVNKMENLEFTIGQLDRAITDLTREVGGLSKTIAALQFDINEIKMFRAKVLGAAAVVAVLASALVEVVAKAWPK